MSEEPVIIEGDKVMGAFMLMQYHACKLHLKGLRHSSGRNIIAHCRRIYGLKGKTNAEVVENFRLKLVAEGVLQDDKSD